MAQEFKVALVDDEPEDIADIVKMLQSIPGICVTYFSGYEKFGNTPTDITASVRKFDLLVLDVYMQEHDSTPFVEFVSRIKSLTPFLAYTRLRRGDDVSIGFHKYEELHRLVLERGGLGLVTKISYSARGPDHPARRDREYEVVERVINYYWVWKLAGR